MADIMLQSVSQIYIVIYIFLSADYILDLLTFILIMSKSVIHNVTYVGCTSGVNVNNILQAAFFAQKFQKRKKTLMT